MVSRGGGMLWVLLGCRARHAHRHSAATTPCGPVKLAPDRAAALLSRQAASSHVASPCDATWASHRRRPLRRHQHAVTPAAPALAAPARHLRVPGQVEVAPQCRRARPTARLPPHSSPPNGQRNHFSTAPTACAARSYQTPHPTATEEKPSQRWRGA
jgi:hypothetical protein